MKAYIVRCWDHQGYEIDSFCYKKEVAEERAKELNDLINDWSLEIERPIKADELPDELRIKYDSLQRIYDNILLEKVFKIDKQPIYEFYCIRNDIIDKMEFE